MYHDIMQVIMYVMYRTILYMIIVYLGIIKVQHEQ